MNNHAPQLGVTLEHYDAEGNLKNVIVNNVPVQQDYKVTTTVKNADGSIASTQEIPFKSFTRNFALINNYLLFGIDNATTIKTTSNAAPSATINTMDVLAAANEDAYGIVVGLNDYTAGALASVGAYVSGKDYALKHQIAEGTSAGQLTHGATTGDTYSIGEVKFTLTRTFVNDTAASITVGEVGLIGVDNTTDYVLLARDVQKEDYSTIAVAVGVGQTLEVKYTINLGSIDWEYTYGGGANQVLNQNLLGIWRSHMSGTAQNMVDTDGQTSSVDFSANPTYALTTAPAATTSYGVIVASNASGSVLHTNYNIFLQNTTLTHSGHTALASLSAITAGTAVTGVEAYTTLNNVRQDSIQKNVYAMAIGTQRDFKNETATSVVLNRIGLVAAGSGASARALLAEAALTTPVTLANLETLRVKLYINFPYALL